MATGNLNIALILKLVDQVSGPAKGANAALRQIGDITEQTGRTGVEWANRQLEAIDARRAALQGEALGLVALGGSLLALTEPAIQAERRLAEVSKVVEFDSPEGLGILQRQIRELVTSGGLAATAEGMTDIIAAAGRMGVVDANLPDEAKRKELLQFATDAAKMSAAFGISADEAGTTLARWRENLKLTHTEAMLLGDAVNMLGNTMATSEADILQVINRQGVVAKTAGLASNEIAALSATLLAAGSSPEIAATGLKNFTNALTKGESVTKRQAAVYKALGIDPEQLAKDMQVNATAAMTSVLEAFEKVPEHKRNAMVGILFGEEAKGAIMPLIANLDQLETAFAKVADTSRLMGLMEEEYQRQAATTYVQRQRLIEYAKGLSVTIGAAVLPQLNSLMETLMPLIAQVTELAAAHPELINGFMKAALALFTFKLSSIALRWTLFSLLPPFLHIIRAGSWLLALAPQLARGLLALLNPLKLVKAALVAIRVAFLATGIGALLAGVAMAGVWIYNNWSGLGAFFTGFWQGFREALGPAAPMLDRVTAAVKGIWEWLSNLLGPMDATMAQWSAWGTAAGEAIGGFLAKLGEWTGVNGEVLLSVGAIYAGFSALRLIWWLPAAPIIAAGQLLLAVSKGPLTALLIGVRSVGKAFVRLGLLVLANPIGLLIASVAALAVAVYQNWDKIVAAIMEKIDVVNAAFDEGLIKGVFKVLAEFNPFTLAVEGAIGLVAYVLELLGVPDQIIAKFKEFSLFATGVDLMKSLWDGMASIVDAAVSFIVEKFKSLKPQWLSDLQGWISGEGSTPSSQARRTTRTKRPIRGNRDRGGPVLPGLSYLVGERAPEIFVPKVAGNILPALASSAIMKVSNMALGRGRVSALQAMQPKAANLAKAASLALAPVLTSSPALAHTPTQVSQRIDQRSPISAPAPAPQITRQGDNITIHITPPQGTDEETIARLVMQELDRRDSERRADLHDGVDY